MSAIVAEIDALLAHPHWEALGAPIDGWMVNFPDKAPGWHRTTILTWIYLGKGVIQFRELVPRFDSSQLEPPPASGRVRRTLRQVLRGLESLQLVQITVFDDAVERGTAPNSLGEGALVSLTTLGVIWLRRAWTARGRIGGWPDSWVPSAESVLHAHSILVEEEDSGKGNDPYWVENLLSSAASDADKRCHVAREAPAARSVFELARRRR